MRFYKSAIVLVTVGLLTACASDSAKTSAKNPQATVDARKALMQSILTDLKVVVAYIQGKSDDTALVAKAAQGISAKASSIPEAFRAEVHAGNSGAVKTRAVPLIWSQWNDFSQAAVNLKQSSDALSKGAAAGDWKAIEAGFEAVEKSCGACHKQFRAKKP